MKICLINPPFTIVKETGIEYSNDSFYNYPYLGIRYLEASLVQAGFEVDVYDCPCEDLSLKELYSKLLAGNYMFIGVSMFYYNLMSSERILKYLSKNLKNSFIFVGGYFATLDYEYVLRSHENIKCVVLGDGEKILVDLMQTLRDNIDWENTPGIAYVDEKNNIQCNPHGQLENLDDLPYPSHRIYRYSTVSTMLTSRGCYAGCSFCSEKKFYSFNQFSKPFRLRSIENVMGELEQIIQKESPRGIIFCDSNFMPANEKRKMWLLNFFGEIKKRNIRLDFTANLRANDLIYYKDYLDFFASAGLNHYFIGIESFNQRQLDLYNKHTTVEQNIEALKILKQKNLTIEFGLIIIEPYVTVNEIAENLEILDSLDLYDNVNYYQFVYSILLELFVTNGTEIFDKVVKDNLKSNKNIGYDFLNKDVDIYYAKLKIWMDFVRDFTYLANLVAKSIYMGLDVYRQDLRNCQSEIGRLDVKFMKDLVLCYKDNEKTTDLIVKYKQQILNVVNNHINSIEYIKSL